MPELQKGTEKQSDGNCLFLKPFAASLLRWSGGNLLLCPAEIPIVRRKLA